MLKLNCCEIELIIWIKMDFALNNLQSLICHETQQTKPNLIMYARHKKIFSQKKSPSLSRERCLSVFYIEK